MNPQRKPYPMQGIRSLAVLLVARLAVVSGRLLGRAAPSPATAESQAGLDGFTISFEVVNYDYFGLTDEWSSPWGNDIEENKEIKEDKEDKEAKEENASKVGKDEDDTFHWLPKLELPNVTKSIEHMGGLLDNHNMLKPSQSVHAHDFHLEIASDRTASKITSFLQDTDSLTQLFDSVRSRPSVTMMDALRAAITKAIGDSIESEKSALSSASPAGASTVVSGPAPAPVGAQSSAPSPAAVPLGPSIHITFRPGAKRPTASFIALDAKIAAAKAVAASKVNATFVAVEQPRMLNKPRASLISTDMVSEAHWSVIVDVTITDLPSNGVNDLKGSKKLLRKAMVSRHLEGHLQESMYEVTGDKPEVRHLELKPVVIKQWDIVKCEKHFSTIVNMFTVHYTRAQVPMALYNECTNFMPKMSFSRDHILDSMDASRCRQATVAFEKAWQFGGNSSPKDFAQMCIETCEAKYGDDAPLCHVSEGMELKGKPI